MCAPVHLVFARIFTQIFGLLFAMVGVIVAGDVWSYCAAHFQQTYTMSNKDIVYNVLCIHNQTNTTTHFVEYFVKHLSDFSIFRNHFWVKF